jgi:hypothetical protein
MHTIEHVLSLRLVIVWAAAMVVCGLSLTALLYLVLHQPGQRAAPRQPRASLCLADYAGYGACVRQAGHIGQHTDALGYRFPPAGGLTDSHGRIWLPRTPPPPPRPPAAFSAPRIRREVVPLCERIGAYYVRADTPVARILSQSGWRSWD